MLVTIPFSTYFLFYLQLQLLSIANCSICVLVTITLTIFSASVPGESDANMEGIISSDPDRGKLEQIDIDKKISISSVPHHRYFIVHTMVSADSMH